MNQDAFSRFGRPQCTFPFKYLPGEVYLEAHLVRVPPPRLCSSTFWLIYSTRCIHYILRSRLEKLDGSPHFIDQVKPRSSEPGDPEPTLWAGFTETFGVCSQRLSLPLSNMPPSKSDKSGLLFPHSTQAQTLLAQTVGFGLSKPFPAACNSLPVVVYFAIHSFHSFKHALTTCQVPNSSLMMVLGMITHSAAVFH